MATHVPIMMREDALTDDERADLLRQASDPTTPGPALLQLLGQPFFFLKPVVVGNPALPVDVIARLLRAPPTVGNLPVLVALWLNPAVSLVLLNEPDPEYLESGHLTLRHLSRRRFEDAMRRSLPGLVEDWCLVAPLGTESIAPYPADVLALKLARRLADLFSLPWSEGT